MNVFDLAAEARMSVAIEERCDWKKWDAGLVEGGSLLGRDGYNSSLRPLSWQPLLDHFGFYAGHMMSTWEPLWFH